MSEWQLWVGKCFMTQYLEYLYQKLTGRASTVTSDGAYQKARSGTMARLCLRLQAESSQPAFYDISEGDEIVEEQPRQHVNCLETSVEYKLEETNRIDEVLGSSMSDDISLVKV
ncbi:hypothetical protein KIN20_038106 [Parelaphostrongylus tenuis]|uniref:Uncharacterized protein n=1 Tax=Parelaphostrongylus tenuis TaxID=148309 RepID=A0AAD5RIF0_PARTN|nr:hypothetical protein KIN20_038106 [Parelaphostrongylus tenuis]